MRLVNADKLLEAFSNSKHIKETTSGLCVMEMEAIKEIIDNAETYNQVGHKMATAEGFITNPEWIKGDLISRSALKKSFENIQEISECGEYITDEMFDLIDNAPTIETYPFEQVQELVKLNQQFAQEIENLKKPQGEWEITGETDEFYGLVYRCTHCGKEVLACGCRNFCTWCGAAMRKEE